MGKQSEAWKALEKRTAERLNGRRIIRRWDLFESAPDVVVEDLHLVVDTKRYRRFAHHGLLDAVQSKYCGEGEIAVLVTSTPQRRDPVVSLPLSYFAELLDELRQRRKDEVEP